MRHRHHPGVMTQTASLDREYTEIRTKLNALTPKDRMNTAIITVLAIIIIAATVTGVEILRAMHPVEVTDYIINHTESIAKTGTEPNHDYMLESIKTDKRQYSAGESMDLEIKIKVPQALPATIEIELVDNHNETMYRYKSDLTVTDSIQKEILLTENYRPGMYNARSRLIIHDGPGYMLTGMTSFAIGNHARKADTTQLLLILIILLNISIMQYHARKT